MSIRKVEGRWGTVYYEGKDEYVGKSLHNYGEYNPEETEMILSLAKGLCLDIGANFGVMTQALEKNGFECIAFEPQPYVFKILQMNVKNCRNFGLGDMPGSFKMPRIFDGDRANYGGNGILREGMEIPVGYPTIEVHVKTLDSLQLDNVGFMKIDVEGFEEKVLRGAVETIKRCRPTMYIEDDRIENSARLRHFIKTLGYTIEEHKPPLYRENNFFGKKVNVWDKIYASHNIICRPL